MTKTIEAVYANGVLKPIQPVEGIVENAHVMVTITTADSPHLLADVFGILPDEDAREMMQIIDAEFSKVDLNDWK